MPVPLPATRLDPTSITSRDELAAALTALRERAGLTVRDVARRSGVPVATVGGYYSGRHVPPVSATEQVVALLEVCGVPAEEHAAWVDAVARARRAPGRRAASGPVPYRGLAAFQAEDAEWFFGREALTRALVERATAPGTRVPLVVVGASGAGKSSVLRAGLIPALSAEAGRVPAVLLTPGASPVEALAAALATAPAGEPTPVPRAVVVDQLEEIFTAGADDTERLRFTEALGRLAGDGVPVVLGLRADFFGDALRVPALLAWLQENQMVVGAMSAAELRRAIVEPARRAGVDVEGALVEAVLADLQIHGGAPADRPYDAGSLPMLSHALWATWERGARRTLTVSDYRAAGGIEGAVATTAERVVSQLEPAEQDRARRLLLRLVHVAEDTADTRRRVPRDALVTDPEDADLLERFVEARLVTVDETHAQIAHEALLVAWPRLRGWIDADRAGLRTHRGLADAAATWDGAGRDPDVLYRGARLELARSWAASAVSRSELRPVERDFLEASASHEAAESRSRRRRTQQLRRLVAVLAVLLLVAASLGVVAFQRGQEARREADVALSRQIAMASDDLRGTDPAVSAQLAMAAYDIHPTVEARSSLLSATAEPSVARLLQADGAQQAVAVSPDGSYAATAGADTWVRLVALGLDGGLVGEPLDGGDGTVFAVALSPDGQVLAAGGGDAVVRLWDVRDPANPSVIGEPLAGPASTVYALAFSPDGETVAAGSADGSVHVWDLSSPADGHRAFPAGTVQAVVFAADGRALVAGTNEGEVHVWPLTGGRPGAPAVLPSEHGAVLSVAVSPDSETVAAGTADGTVARWDLRDPAAPVAVEPLTGPSSWVNGLRFSDDGQVLAAASSDEDVWQWDAATGAVHATLAHPAAVTAVAFVPGTHDVVSTANDGIVRWWDGVRRSVPTSTATVFALAYGADGDRLATASRTGVQLWDLTGSTGAASLGEPITVPGSDVPFTGASFSADGSTVAAGDRDGFVHAWSIDAAGNADGPTTRRPHADLVESIALSSDGTLLASGSDDTTAGIWDRSAAAEPASLTGATNYVYAVDLSPDLQTLAVGSVDESVYLWDVSDPSAPALLGEPLTGPAGYIGGVAFSPDGRVLAAGSDDATVRLWDVSDPSAPAPLGEALTWADSTVWELGFTVDGRFLVATSSDGAARVWDVSEPDEPRRYASLTGDAGRLFSLALSPDGSTAATAGSAATVRFFDLDVDAARERICGVGGMAITPAEWAKYLPDVAYAAPCG